MTHKEIQYASGWEQSVQVKVILDQVIPMFLKANKGTPDFIKGIKEGLAYQLEKTLDEI